MAGRYVLLEFDNAKDAQAFVDMSQVKPRSYKVMAMLIRPNKFCQCPDKQRQNNKNWLKGKRTGLYLCVRCRKPSVHHQMGVLPRLKYVFGNNLLDQE